MPRFTRSRNGQSLVEFALLLPVLVLILLGALDLGRAFSAYVAITNAAREAARYGATHLKDGSGNLNSVGMANQAMTEAALGGITILPTDVQVACAPFGSNSFDASNCTSPALGDQLRVTVSNDFQFMSLYLFRIPGIRLTNFAVSAIIKL